jgi:superfamily I DNA and/or RNA helicase
MARDGIEWECLEKFVPEADRKIIELKAELKEARLEIERLTMLKTGARVVEIDEAAQIVAKRCADIVRHRG